MQQPSLKKNYLYRVFYEVLILITPFITTPYVSRVLGADGVGVYSYTYSIITYFFLGTSLTVYPAAGIPRLTLQHGGKVFIVNAQPTSLDDLAVARLDDLAKFADMV